MRGARIFAIFVGIVILAFVALMVLAAIFGFLLETLYISLIILALLMVAATLFQVYSIIMFIRAIQTVRDEMKPLIASVNETLGMVKDTAQAAGGTVAAVGQTTQFASELTLGPGVRTVASVLAGQQVLRTFFGRGTVRKQYERRRQEQAAAAARQERG
jgi:hypothetical protein